jgi:protocatechuate 3,4-dioxygenase beta subunit
MKMRKTILVAAGLLILAAMIFAVTARSQSVPIGTLEGTVLDAHGKPVADASVTIQTSDGLHPHATHTDANGHFEFTRWKAGEYDVRAYGNGLFSEWNKHIMIRSKKATKITLRLPRTADEKVTVSN